MKLLKLKKYFFDMGFIVEIIEHDMNDVGDVVYIENLINLDIESRTQFFIFSTSQQKEFVISLSNEDFHINCVRCLFEGKIYWMPLNQFEEVV